MRLWFCLVALVGGFRLAEKRWLSFLGPSH